MPLTAGLEERADVIAADEVNPMSAMLARYDLAAQHLGLDAGMNRLLAHPEYEIQVSVPVEMDNGDVQVFTGYRVIHNTARGPGKGGIRFDAGVSIEEVRALAAWMVREGVEVGDLADRLERAKRDGLANVSEIITRHAVPRGWPAGVALQYLTIYMRYDIGPRQLEAIRLFHHKAAEQGIVPSPARELLIH